MSPSFTSKGQKRYRYYVSQAVLQFKEDEAGSVIRLPALEIETPIIEKIEFLLSSVNEVLALIPERLNTKQMADLARHMKDQCDALRSLSPHPKITLLKTLIQWITVSQHALTVTIHIAGLRELLGIASEGTDSASLNDTEGACIKTWTLPISLRRYGSEVKLILGDRKSQPPAQPMVAQGLQRALMKALIWNEDLLTGKTASLADIAKQEKVTQRYIARMIRLAFLAPDLQDAILQGKVPCTWTVDHFREAVPLDWAQQRLRFRLRPET